MYYMNKSIDLIFSAAVLSAGSAAATVKVLIFFIALMLVFWGLNVYRHIKSGKWEKFQQTVDIAGLLFFAVMIILLIIPLV